MSKLEKGSKKLLHAWAFYDWANSVYPLVISSAVFPIFYGALTIIKDEETGKILDDTVQFLGYEINNDSLISYVTAFSFLIVSFLSPILSGISDYVGNKESFMKFFCYLGAISCIGLYWFSIENIVFGMVCYIFGLVGFWGSLVFYNSYLPDIAYPEQQDKVSAKGFSLGYIGSVILLVVNLVMILKYDWFGFQNDAQPTRIAFIMVGVWWILFAQYTFRYLPTGTNEGHKVTKTVLVSGFNELKKIWHALKSNRILKRYLSAFFIYSMAVQTIMLAATYFAVEELDWGTQDSTTGLIISILLIQLIAIVGANYTAKLSKKIGNIKALISVIAIWILICGFAYFIKTPIQFYITAASVGLVMGGIQALSRSTYSKLIPFGSEDTASYFSFYDVAEKIGLTIGLFLYGFVAQITGSMRYSILFLITFFIIGLLILNTIKNVKISEE
ncbi:MFS transporter [Winogradskyella tangerina]|uniref:MFS transporter n=1 Tax=Winogradskyella tangerina TaxID=2023240 RepID=UPI000DBE80F5|nr:MFS transporter [Winogradskyella tangerina]